jgi:hypothetical protein
VVESKKKIGLVSADEEIGISRRMVVWANSFPDSPVGFINYEQLDGEANSMALSTIQGTYITKRFICGGYEAEYQFKIVYRIFAGNSNDARLSADELLDRFGDWATTEKPEIWDGIRVLKVEPTTRSSLFAAYDDGTEDHQIMMRMIYEVI